MFKKLTTQVREEEAWQVPLGRWIDCVKYVYTARMGTFPRIVSTRQSKSDLISGFFIGCLTIFFEVLTYVFVVAH